MRRTKEWWAQLTKEERSELVKLERAEASDLDKFLASDEKSKLAPGEKSKCGNCSAPHLGHGLCPRCFARLLELINKANAGEIARVRAGR